MIGNVITMKNLRIVAQFQFGQRAAIEALARNRASIWIGILLVLMTAIARNYDQTYFLESPFWLIGPLLFSICSGSFLFLVLYTWFIRRHIETTERMPSATQWRSF